MSAGSTIWRDEYGYWRTGWCVLFGAFLVLVAAAAITAGVLAGVNYFGGEGCRRTLNSMEREGEYSFWTGCMVEADNGELVPLDNWRLTQDGEP